MRWKKFMIILVLLIFTTGMLMGAASASHTFKKGKYKVTVSDKTYKKIKKGKKYIDKKVGSKKVKKWKYKKVLQSKDVWSSDWSDYTCKDYNIDKYWKNGWTYYGSKTIKSSDGRVYKNYAKFKKKVTVKKPVYMHVGAVYDFGKEKYTGKCYVIVDTHKYAVF
jgi:hypothetical protein